MEFHYTSEKNHQILIALLKASGIRYVVASPGATNVSFVASVQSDPFFKVYSSVDERSAAYIACGLAGESGEPVVLSCTGATAARNYYPGLTEAFYRKLPLIAVTSSQVSYNEGRLIPQVTDRSHPTTDIQVYHTTLKAVKDETDFKECMLKVNAGLIALKRNSGGPIHFNLETTYSTDYSIRNLPAVKKIEYLGYESSFPSLDKYTKIAFSVGSHRAFTEEETILMDKFCEKYGAVVICDHTSGYYGKYRIQGSIIGAQGSFDKRSYMPDLGIHIGEVSGDYESDLLFHGRDIWRVSEDGEAKDKYEGMTKLFGISLKAFLIKYLSGPKQATPVSRSSEYFNTIRNLELSLRQDMGEVPFSNIWLARELTPKIPANSVVHLGILNSLRCWNLFRLPQTVTSTSIVGGFGIDGSLSTILGASLVHPDRLYYLVIGDLAFFYDLNALGNRHVGNNLRILLVNNGVGTEFKNYNHRVAEFGDDGDAFMAARGHYGRQSRALIKHFSEDLGFRYLSASNKQEFLNCYSEFISPEISGPMLFEVFTDSKDESQALRVVRNIRTSANMSATRGIQSFLKHHLPEDTYNKIKAFAKQLFFRR